MSIFSSDEIAQLPASQLSWCILNYEADQDFAKDADEIMELPGVERLFLYFAYLAGVAAGQLSLDKPLTYSEAHRAFSQSGILRWIDPPTVLCAKDALAQMIITGDDIGLALVCEALKAEGHDPKAYLERFLSITNLRGTAVGDVQIVDGYVVALAMKSTSRDLARLVDAVGALSQGETPNLPLKLTSELARVALEVMASVSDRSGLPGLLPSYGPFHTKSPHLLVDGGSDSPWQKKNWVDVALVYRDAQRAYTAAVVCRDVPAEIEGIPGGYVARRTMSIIGRQCWMGQQP